MLFSTPSYVTLLAAALFSASCQASDIKRVYLPFDGMTDPSNYMFYDPTEDCKNSKSICLTSFKYCTFVVDEYAVIHTHDYKQCASDAKKDDLSWITGNNDDAVRWIELERRPIVLYGREANYTLKWQNHNPKYPTNVTWETVYSITEEPFYLYTVVPAGESEFHFSLDQLPSKMLPSKYLPTGNKTKDQNQNITRIVTDFMAAAGDLQFYVSQPEDPAYYSNHAAYDLQANLTDTTSRFRFGFRSAYNLYFAQEDARGYIKQQDKATHKRWSIGVGFGVGLGVPLVALISFFVGKRMGRKAEPRVGKSMEMK